MGEAEAKGRGVTRCPKNKCARTKCSKIRIRTKKVERDLSEIGIRTVEVRRDLKDLRLIRRSETASSAAVGIGHPRQFRARVSVLGLPEYQCWAAPSASSAACDSNL